MKCASQADGAYCHRLILFLYVIGVGAIYTIYYIAHLCTYGLYNNEHSDKLYDSKPSSISLEGTFKNMSRTIAGYDCAGSEWTCYGYFVI